MKNTILFLLFLITNLIFCQERKGIDYQIVEKVYSEKQGGYQLDKYHILRQNFLEKEFLLNLNLKDLRKTNENDNLVHSIIEDAYYENKILFYESDRKEDTIVLWKLDGEYYSQIYFFHFNNEKMSFLGEIYIGDDCANDGCEAFNVPKGKIHVSKQYDFISVLFKGKNTFFSKEFSPNGSLSSENLTLHFRLIN